MPLRLLLLLVLVSTTVLPVLAQVNTAQSATHPKSTAEQQDATRNLQNELEEARRRNLILEARRDLAEEAYARFEIGMGGLGVLITLLVLGFGIFTYRAAVAAARQELADVAGKVRELQSEAVIAKENAETAAQAAQGAAEGAKAHEQRAEASSEQVRLVAALAERQLKPSSADSPEKPELSAAERVSVSDAADTVSEKPEREWSADEFRVKILQAYDSNNWLELLRLSRGMSFIHSGNTDDLAFAMFQEALALSSLGRYDESIAVYDQIIAAFSDSSTEATKDVAQTAKYNKAIALTDKGDSVAALATYDEIIGSRETEERPYLHSLRASAMYNKACRLSDMEQREQEIESLQNMIREYEDSAIPEIRRTLSRAMVNLAICLFDRRQEEEEVYNKIIRLFDDDMTTELQEAVAIAKCNLSSNAGDEGRYEDSKQLAEDAFRRVCESHTQEGIELVARARYNRGLALHALGDREDAEEEYKLLIDHIDHHGLTKLKDVLIGTLFALAGVYALSQETEKAQIALERWGTERGSFDCGAIARSADFDPIRQAPRFSEFLMSKGCAEGSVSNPDKEL